MAENWRNVSGGGNWRTVESVNLPEPPQRNALVAGISSGIDDFQGLMYSAGAAVADAVGAQRVRDWMNQQADENQYESQINGRSDLDRIEDQSLASFPAYAVYQVGKQVPNILGTVAASAVIPEAVVPAALSRGLAYAPKWLGGGALGAAEGFAAKKAALKAGQGMAEDVLGGAAMNYAQGVGSLYQESVDGGDPNSGLSALAGGVPYGLTETLPEAMLLGRIKRGSGFSGNLLSRVGKSGISQAATGATSELLQNEMEMAYNGGVSPDEAFSKRLNSGVAGGLVEGIMGGFGGMRGHSNRTATAVEQGHTADLLGGTTPTTTDSTVVVPPVQPVVEAPITTGSLTGFDPQTALAPQGSNLTGNGGGMFQPNVDISQQVAENAQRQQREQVIAQEQQRYVELRAKAAEEFLPPGPDGKPQTTKLPADLVKLHQDLNAATSNGVISPESYAQAVGRVRLALQEGDKTGIAAVKSDLRESQSAFDTANRKAEAEAKKAQAKAEAEAKKKQAEAEKVAKQKAEDKKVTQQALADNAASAAAAAPVQQTVTPAPAVHVNSLEDAANVLLSDTPTDTGTAQTSPAATGISAGVLEPVQAGGVQPAAGPSTAVAQSAGQGAVATAATHDPVELPNKRKVKVSILNPQGGLVAVNNLQGASPEVTSALVGAKAGKGGNDLVLIRNDSGELKAVKRNQWDILRMARGLDEQGHATREPMTGQQIADAMVASGLIQKGSRSTVTKSLNELGEFGLKEIKQAARQDNLAAKDDGSLAFDHNEDGTATAVQATDRHAVEDAVDAKQSAEADAADARPGEELEEDAVLRRLPQALQAQPQDVVDAREEFAKIAELSGHDDWSWDSLPLEDKAAFTGKFMASFDPRVTTDPVDYRNEAYDDFRRTFEKEQEKQRANRETKTAVPALDSGKASVDGQKRLAAPAEERGVPRGAGVVEATSREVGAEPKGRGASEQRDGAAGRESAPTVNKAAKTAGSEVAKPGEATKVSVELKNSDGTTLKVPDAHAELVRLSSKMQKLEALIKCLG